MTWYLVRETGEIWDHSGSVVGTLSKPYTYDKITAVMRSTFEECANLGDSPVMDEYAGLLLVHWIDHDVQRVDSEDDLPNDYS